MQSWNLKILRFVISECDYLWFYLTILVFIIHQGNPQEALHDYVEGFEYINRENNKYEYKAMCES